MRSEARSLAMLVLGFLMMGQGTNDAAAQESAPGGHRVEVGVYAGRWDFDSGMRFADDAVLGLSLGMQFFPWMNTEVTFDQVTTQDRDSRSWVRAVTGSIHARIEPWQPGAVVPGFLAGVAFMMFDEERRADALSEGLDLGLGVRWRATPVWTVRTDLLWRYQTVRFIPTTEEGVILDDAEETGYFGSFGLTLGVSIAL